MARSAEEDGIRVLAATPHVRDDHPTTPAQMERLLDGLRNRTKVETDGRFLLTIKYQDSDPVRARDVVQAISRTLRDIGWDFQRHVAVHALGLLPRRAEQGCRLGQVLQRQGVHQVLSISDAFAHQAGQQPVHHAQVQHQVGHHPLRAGRDLRRGPRPAGK